MATHSSVLAWRIPGTGAPGGLPSMGSHRVGHNWSDLAAVPVYIYQIHSSIHFTPFPPWYICFLHIWLYICFTNRFMSIVFLDSSYKWYYIFVSLFLTYFTGWESPGLSMSLQMVQFCSFSWLGNIHFVQVPHLLYPFLCWWTFRLLPWPTYCK